MGQQLECCGARENESSLEDRIKLLKKVPLVRRIRPDKHRALAACCEEHCYKPGDFVMKEGAIDDSLVVIKSGEAEVVSEDSAKSDSSQLAVLSCGGYFGENALLRDEPRLTAIVARTDLETLTISRKKFRKMGLHEAFIVDKRHAVCEGTMDEPEVRRPTPKSDEERQFILKALIANEPLSSIVKISEAKMHKMIDLMWEEDVKEGHEIIQQGDYNANYFYVVHKGLFDVSIAVSEQDKVSSKEGVVTHNVRSFGELALLYQAPRAATVKARTDSSVWVIDRYNFKKILQSDNSATVESYIQTFDGVDILRSLQDNQKRIVAAALVEETWQKGEIVMKQGEPGDHFYILYSGTVDILVDGKKKASKSGDVESNKAAYFGERALLKNEPRAATVKVVSKSATLLSLERQVFELCLGQNIPSHLQKKKIQNTMPLSELSLVGILGTGMCGTVELYEHKPSGETYALKSVSKGFIAKHGMQNQMINEKNILLMCDSPFIIKLVQTYNIQSPIDRQAIGFLLEPALGGELFNVYRAHQLFGSEPHAKYYTAGIVNAFEHLHERHLIYRDLKPENVLLNATGHLKLADMGFAKFTYSKAFTTCGTSDYFAPEMIAGTGHTNALDWWTLGIFAFELLVGYAPFSSDSTWGTYNAIIKGIDRVAFPEAYRGNSKTLIVGLLKQTPDARLPLLRPGGIENIRKSAWLEDFDWQSMMTASYEPPYIPTVKDKKDIANFPEPDFKPPNMQFKDDGSGWDKEF